MCVLALLLMSDDVEREREIQDFRWNKQQSVGFFFIIINFLRKEKRTRLIKKENKMPDFYFT